MYKQYHRDGTYEYFVYAPLTRGKGPKPPFANAPARMRTVYFYWWSFLRLSEDYAMCCRRGGAGPLGELYRDFGDIRKEDFLSWWRKRGARCFAEPRRRKRVSRVRDLDSLAGIPEDTILVSIPTDGNVDDILRGVRRILQTEADGRNKGNAQYSRAKYRVVGSPNLASLYKILKVKEAQMRLPKTATRFEIAVGADIFPGSHKALKDGVKRAEMSNFVTKALKKADVLIQNVALGRFPVFAKGTTV